MHRVGVTPERGTLAELRSSRGQHGKPLPTPPAKAVLDLPRDDPVAIRVDPMDPLEIATAGDLPDLAAPSVLRSHCAALGAQMRDALELEDGDESDEALRSALDKLLRVAGRLTPLELQECLRGLLARAVENDLDDNVRIILAGLLAAPVRDKCELLMARSAPDEPSHRMGGILPTVREAPEIPLLVRFFSQVHEASEPPEDQWAEARSLGTYLQTCLESRKLTTHDKGKLVASAWATDEGEVIAAPLALLNNNIGALALVMVLVLKAARPATIRPQLLDRLGVTPQQLLQRLQSMRKSGVPNTTRCWIDTITEAIEQGLAELPMTFRARTAEPGSRSRTPSPGWEPAGAARGATSASAPAS